MNTRVHIFEHEELEHHPFYVKFLRFFTVPILNSIPSRVLQRLIRRTSPAYGAKVIERPGTTHSLEAMYTKNKPSFLQNLADFFWHNVVSQPKAVRNRLRIVEKILNDELVTASGNVQIFNLGGGSSRAIIGVVSRHKDRALKIHVTTIDKDPRAIELGKETAHRFGVGEMFNWINDDVRNLRKLAAPNSADIVEMVGLLDYFDNASSMELIKEIYRIVKPSGVFIVANVHPNNESKFVTNVGWPRMHYKNTEELGNILNAAGFREEYMTIYFEPLKVHIVGVARK